MRKYITLLFLLGPAISGAAGLSPCYKISPKLVGRTANGRLYVAAANYIESSNRGRGFSFSRAISQCTTSERSGVGVANEQSGLIQGILAIKGIEGNDIFEFRIPEHTSHACALGSLFSQIQSQNMEHGRVTAELENAINESQYPYHFYESWYQIALRIVGEGPTAVQVDEERDLRVQTMECI